jgi:hypothetical protein
MQWNPQANMSCNIHASECAVVASQLAIHLAGIDQKQ